MVGEDVAGRPKLGLILSLAERLWSIRRRVAASGCKAERNELDFDG